MTDFQDSRLILSDLTALRGIFALWVFGYHANLHLHFAAMDGIIGRGYLGVDGFFILSGLVLAHRHPAPPQAFPAYARFWWRRLIRLYPTVLAMLLLLGAGFLLARAGGVHPHQALRADGHEFLLQLFLLNGWGFSEGWTWNYPSWSISTEWAGYLLFPALAWLAARLDARGACLSAAIMGICLLTVAGFSPSGLNLSYQGALPRFLPEFIGGVSLARLLRIDGARPPAALLAIMGCLLIPIGVWLRGVTTLGDAVTVFGLAAILWVLAAGRQRVFAQLPSLIILGALSYPFYMAYAPVELLFARFWRAAHLDPTTLPFVWLVLIFAGVLALAYVTARFVERPALQHLAGPRMDS